MSRSCSTAVRRLHAEEGHRGRDPVPELVAGRELIDHDAGRCARGRVVQVHHQVEREAVAPRRELGEQRPAGVGVEAHHVHHVGAHGRERGQELVLDVGGAEVLAGVVDPGVVRVPDRRIPVVGDDRAPPRGLHASEAGVERAPEPRGVVGNGHRVESRGGRRLGSGPMITATAVPGRPADGRTGRSRFVRAPGRRARRLPLARRDRAGRGDLERLASQFGLHPLTVEDIGEGPSAHEDRALRGLRVHRAASGPV